jgi:tRNA-2-methylthio-N6-dimethylallyladenosine synthase
VEGIRRVRFTSPYPTDFTDEVIAAMAEVPSVCEHVHLPAQSGSDSCLKRMLRRYRRPEYLDVVARLRAAIPGITFSTDLIVGFPGETEAEFQDTLSLVGEAGFDEAYTFKYSPRDGTPAVRMPGHIDDAVASERLDRLIAVVRDQSRRRNIGRVGEVHEVLVERPAKRGDLLLGRTRHNSMVLLDLPVTALGSYRTVRLSGTTGSTFTGELLSEAPALAVL